MSSTKPPSAPPDPAGALRALGLVEDETLDNVMAYDLARAGRGLEGWALDLVLRAWTATNNRRPSRYRLSKGLLWLA